MNRAYSTLSNPNHLMKIIGKFALGALLAVALACNANAKEEGKQQKQQNEEKQKKEQKVKWIDPIPDAKKDKRTYSVPEAGSTAALLGVSVALVALARRRITRKWSDRLSSLARTNRALKVAIQCGHEQRFIQLCFRFQAGSNNSSLASR